MARRTKGRIYRNGANYWLEYRHQGERHRVTLGTDSLKTARSKAAGILRPFSAETEADRRREAAQSLATAEEIAKEAIRTAAGRVKVADAWQKFQADKQRPQSGPHTLTDYGRHWERFAAWLKAEYPTVTELEQVTPELAERHMTHLDGLGLGPNRYNKARQALSLVFRVLSRRCGDMPDPFREVKKKTLAPESHRALSVDELRNVCSTASGELRAVLALGMFTGLRIADACLLDWREVDLTAGRIVRVPSKIRGRKNKPVIIPLHPALRTILEETPEAGRRGPVNPELAELYKRDAGATISKRIRDHFSTCGIHDVNTRKALQERKDAGVKLGRLRAAPVASFHSLRHSFVSLLANANVPLATVRELVGHHSESIQRVYLHADPEATRHAVNALPELQPSPDTKGDDRASLQAKLAELAKKADTATLRRMLAAGQG